MYISSSSVSSEGGMYSPPIYRCENRHGIFVSKLKIFRICGGDGQVRAALGWARRSLIPLRGGEAQARASGENQFALFHAHAVEGVVGDQEIAVEIGIIRSE